MHEHKFGVVLVEKHTVGFQQIHRLLAPKALSNHILSSIGAF